MMKRLVKKAACLACGIATITAASAAVNEFLGTANADIGTDAKWSLGHQPAAGDDVVMVVPATATGTWEYNPAQGTFTLGRVDLNSFTLRHTGAATARAWSTVRAADALFDFPGTGGVNLTNTGCLTGSGTLTFQIPNGNLVAAGSLANWTGDIVFSNKTTQLTSTGDIAIGGAGKTVTLHTLSAQSPLAVSGAVNFLGGFKVVQSVGRTADITQFNFPKSAVFNGLVEVKDFSQNVYFQDAGAKTFLAGISGKAPSLFVGGADNKLTTTNRVSGGAVTLDGNFYIFNSALRLSAPVTASKVIAGYYTAALICEADNLFANVENGLEMGVNWTSTTIGLVLKQSKQKVNALATYSQCAATISGEDASTFENADPADKTFAGALKGDLSVVYSGGGQWTLTGANNDMNGILKVTHGTIRLASGSRFPNITGLEIAGEGRLIVEDAQSIPANLATLRVANGGQLSLPYGVTLIVDRAVIGGDALEPSVYNFSNYASCVTGGGSLTVLLEPLAEPGETYTWTGLGNDGRIENAANWDKTPKFNKTAQLVFAGTTRTALSVNSEVKAYSVTFSGDADYTVSAANGGSLTIYKTLSTTANGRTVTIDAPIVTALEDGEWNVAAGTTLQINGAISGGAVEREVWQRGAGTLKLAGDNRNWMSRLVVTNGATWAQHEWALGSDQRSFMFYGDATVADFNAHCGAKSSPYLRFDPETRAATRLGRETPLVMTNYTPVAFCGFPGILVPSRFDAGTQRPLDPGYTVVFTKPITKMPGGYDTITYLSQWYSTLQLDGGLVMDEEDSFNLGYEGGFLFVNGPITGGTLVTLGITGEKTAFAPSAESRLKTLNHMYGTLRFAGDEAFGSVNPPVLSLGVSWSTSPTIADLDGHTVNVAHLVFARAQGVTYEITSASENPGMVRVTDDVSMSGQVGNLRFTGAAGLTYAGAGVMRLDVASDTMAPLVVESGTLLFVVGESGWHGSTNVTVRGTGRIQAQYKRAGKMFSADGVTSSVTMLIEGDGKLDLCGDGCTANDAAGLAAGTEIVRKLYVDGEGMPHGDYTRDNCAFVTSGTLRVLRDSMPGTFIIVR